MNYELRIVKIKNMNHALERSDSCKAKRTEGHGKLIVILWTSHKLTIRVVFDNTR
jgi:hypothetical protein